MNTNYNKYKQIISFIVIFVIIMGLVPLGMIDKVIATEANKSNWTFEYTGASENFIVPETGRYKVQVWGAEGGVPHDLTVKGGKGAYVEANSHFDKGAKLIINVGGKGGIGGKYGHEGGFNGGGGGTTLSSGNAFNHGGGGGGASDVRLSSNSLHNRLIVAGGGGGAGKEGSARLHSSWNDKLHLITGGAGGKEQGQSGGVIKDWVFTDESTALVGVNAPYKVSGENGELSGGGSQTSGGYNTEAPYEGNKGKLGMGGGGAIVGTISNWHKGEVSYGGGGGGGYYGGSGGVSVYAPTEKVPHPSSVSGGGGSSYHGGMDELVRWHTGWEMQPKPNGSSQIGHTGHGYVKITKLKDLPEIIIFNEVRIGYHQEDVISMEGTVKGFQSFGDDLRIKMSINDGIEKTVRNFPFTNKPERFDFKIDIDDRFVLGKNTFKVWVEEVGNGKGNEYSYDVFVSKPRSTRITVTPREEGWVNGWTNKDYDIDISIIDETGLEYVNVVNYVENKSLKGKKEEQIITIKVDAQSYSSGKKSILIETRNTRGEEVNYTHQITNIDITPPTAPRIIGTNGIVIPGIDNQSGVKHTLVKVDKGDWMLVEKLDASLIPKLVDIQAKTVDNVGNESVIAIGKVGKDPEIPNDNEQPTFPGGIIEGGEIKDNIVVIDVPQGGTHMQTSLDGVTWSNWNKRQDTTSVTLTTGDGYKTVYVRTGQETVKQTPVFNSILGYTEMIQQKGGEVEPYNNIVIYKYVMDLTAPKLEIRTVDNMLIAINGNITFLLDVVDNLDQKPKVKIEILKRNESGALEDTPIFSKEVQLSEGVATGSITPSKLEESKNSKGKLQPYTLRVTAWDKSNNRTVKHANFYVKNK